MSSVQGLPSLQVGAAPPTHLPPAHPSDVVQALPSSQALVLLATMQPVEVSHESSVQGFLSSQVMVVPVHLPATQWSLLVQALLSLQAFALSLVKTQPLAGAHESSVQGFLSSQANAAPPTHALFAQVSLVVQALLSLHGAVLATLEHPDEELQESSVQGLLSLQFVGPLETQLPPLQWSPVVQALPSLQVFELDTVNTHPVAGAHVSLVHGLLSLQLSAGPPVQVPEPLHLIRRGASVAVGAAGARRIRRGAVLGALVAGAAAAVVRGVQRQTRIPDVYAARADGAGVRAVAEYVVVARRAGLRRTRARARAVAGLAIRGEPAAARAGAADRIDAGQRLSRLTAHRRTGAGGAHSDLHGASVAGRVAVEAARAIRIRAASALHAVPAALHGVEAPQATGF